MATNKFDNPFSAVFHGIKELSKKKNRIGELAKNERIDGKTCLVTGANSGLGFAIAVQLAQRGGQVIMACRSGIPDAGEKVKKLSGSDKVEMVKLDLSDLYSVKAFCDDLEKRQVKLDIIISNAAIVPKKSRKSRQGLEEMFQVNYLAKFYWINRLLENGVIPKESTNNNGIPRIILVSSEAHRSGAAIDFENFGKYQDYTMGKTVSLYGYYKLMLNTFASELHSRLNPDGQTNVAVHALCPGPVNSNIAREAPFIFKPLIKIIFSIFFRSPFKAAEPVLFLSCSSQIENKSGMYLYLMSQKEMDERANDPKIRNNLWIKSEQLLKENIK